MYINIKNLLKQDTEFLPLYLILRHAGKRDVSKEILQLPLTEFEFEHLKSIDMITFIKGTKKQSDIQKMRLTKKSKAYLESLDEVEVSEEDEIFFNWLKDTYIKRDKIVGNGAKTKRLIASFREKSGIDKNKLATLCNHFLNNDDEQSWSMKLEYVFWKPENAYQSRFTLEQSRLYQYYLKNKEYFDKQFKKLDNERK